MNINGIEIPEGIEYNSVFVGEHEYGDYTIYYVVCSLNYEEVWRGQTDLDKLIEENEEAERLRIERECE